MSATRRLIKNSEPNIDAVLDYAVQSGDNHEPSPPSDFDEIEDILSAELSKRLSLPEGGEADNEDEKTEETTNSGKSENEHTDTNVQPLNTDNLLDTDSNSNNDSLFNTKYLGKTEAVAFRQSSIAENGASDLIFDPLLPIEISGIEESVPLSKVSTNELFPIDWSSKSPTKDNMWSYDAFSSRESSKNEANIFTFDNVTTIFDPKMPPVNHMEQTSFSGGSSKVRKSIFSTLFEDSSSSESNGIYNNSHSKTNPISKPTQESTANEPTQTILEIENTLITPTSVMNSTWHTQGFAPQVLATNFFDTNAFITPYNAYGTFNPPNMFDESFFNPLNQYMPKQPNDSQYTQPMSQTTTQPTTQDYSGLSTAIGCINKNNLLNGANNFNNFQNLHEFDSFVPQYTSPKDQFTNAQVYSPRLYSQNHQTHFSRRSSSSYDNNSNVYVPPVPLKPLTEDEVIELTKTVNNYLWEPSPEALNIKKYFKNYDNHLLPKLSYPIDAQGDVTEYKLIACCFKNARMDVFYISQDNRENLKDLKVGDLVVVEADRGKDLGKVVKLNVSVLEARLLRYAQYIGRNGGVSDESHKRPILNFPKLVLRLSKNEELITINSKIVDEVRAIEFCQAKVRDFGMHLTIVDSEYQWDMKKLTLYYNSNVRIDFRDLVKDLFRTYKIRIWLSKHEDPL